MNLNNEWMTKGVYLNIEDLHKSNYILIDTVWTSVLDNIKCFKINPWLQYYNNTLMLPLIIKQLLCLDIAYKTSHILFELELAVYINALYYTVYVDVTDMISK